MNYQKLDSALAGALEEVEDAEAASLTVFIHTAQLLDNEATGILKRLGIATGDGKILTATLSPRAVAQLSEQPWVQSIKLSRSLRALKNPGA